MNAILHCKHIQPYSDMQIQSETTEIEKGRGNTEIQYYRHLTDPKVRLKCIYCGKNRYYR